MIPLRPRHRHRIAPSTTTRVVAMSWLSRRLLRSPRPSQLTRPRPSRRLDFLRLEDRVVPSTVVYENAFESGTETTATGVSATWSDATTGTTPSGRKFRGDYGNQAVTLSLSGLPASAAVSVTFDLYVIRSWDGNGPSNGPDRWSLTSGTGPSAVTLLNETFDNTSGVPADSKFRQSYGGRGRTGEFLPETGVSEENKLGYTFNFSKTGVQPIDTTYAMAYEFVAEADGTAVLTFAGSGLQSLADESWGLDNVAVSTAPTFVSVVSSEDDVAEAGGTGTYTFTRAGDTTAALDVTFQLGGIAGIGVDYSLSGAAGQAGGNYTVTIPAGQASATVTVTGIDDPDPESSEGVSAIVLAGTGYSPAGVPAGVVIVDDDARVEVLVGEGRASESGPTPGSFVLRRQRGLDRGVDRPRVPGGPAVSSDYNVSGAVAVSGSPGVYDVTIAEGDTYSRVTIAPVDDALDEGDETVVLTIGTGNGYYHNRKADDGHGHDSGQRPVRRPGRRGHDHGRDGRRREPVGQR